ncbi:MAG TPA: hypothetical protein VK611_11565 [Acidimicrobiales bacterium]|nr:hypothetical protein [Acidimicrobiales bacterium]
MSDLAAVRVSITVKVDPDTAFAVFTEEIDQWYRQGLGSPTTLRFEPGVGGRLLEVGPDNGPEEERARVTVWEPGQRLVFVDWRDTEVDIRFEAAAEGATRVVLEHRGLDRVPPDVAVNLAKYGWRRLTQWFERHMEERR